MTQRDELLARLRSMGSEENREGMSRFGINVDHAFGISVSDLRTLARELGRNHELSLELWETGYHEARILATIVAEPARINEYQMERWVVDIDSWDLCDQVCSLFVKTPFARQKLDEWTLREEEFVRRAGYVLIAQLAVHDKKAPDELFEDYLEIIRTGTMDDRNFVKRAVNWALRNIGKRNRRLNHLAIELAAELRESPDRSARWTGSNAWRELTSERVRQRLDRVDPV